MIRTRRRGRFSGVIAALAAILAVAVHVTWAPAAVIGPTPAANATINVSSATSGLTTGAEVHFTVNTTSTVTLNKVEAKICRPGFATYTTTTFGYSGSSGTRCVYEPGISSGSLGGQYRLGPIPFSAVTTSGDQKIVVGTGTVNWINTSGFGPPAGLVCDSANPCDLVINVGLTGDTVTDTFFIQQLTFAGGVTTTTTATTAPVTTAPVTTTTTKPTTTTTTAPVTTTTTKPATTTTKPATTTTTAPANAGGSLSPSTVAPGGTFTVQSSEWAAGSALAVTLHSDPVLLGSLTAAADGTAQGPFTLPSGTAVGSHTVELAGTGANSQPRTVSLSLTAQTAAPAPTVGVAGPAAGSTATAAKLAFSGSSSRNMVSIALLLIAVGLFLLGQQSRRRASDPR